MRKFFRVLWRWWWYYRHDIHIRMRREWFKEDNGG